jgi:hypothetical protein
MGCITEFINFLFFFVYFLESLPDHSLLFHVYFGGFETSFLEKGVCGSIIGFLDFDESENCLGNC